MLHMTEVEQSLKKILENNSNWILKKNQINNEICFYKGTKIISIEIQNYGSK